MKKLIALGIALTAAFGFVGCGSNNDSTNNNLNAYNCPIGSTWNGSYCGTVTGGTNITPGTTQLRYYDYIYYFNYSWGFASNVAPSYRKSMRVVNTTVYKKFLKEAMGVCDRNIWGWNTGYASCDAWASGSMILQIDLDSSLKPTVYFTAIPSQQWFSASIGIDGSGMAYNPLGLNQGTYNLINQSKGFEIRANGATTTAGNRHLIQIQAVTGTTADTNINYTIYYPDSAGQPKAILSGTLTRY
ncbi:MAG: hypothetical protein J7501_11690 [Bdellovibrio sp.]|nr:hypothetical protein [Bdellovibrio sp.]